MKTVKQVASHNLKWQFCECTFCLFFLPPSSKAINKAYEEYVLSVGNLDERIFLGEDAEEEVGTLSRCLNTGSGTETAERVQMKSLLQQHFDKVSQGCPRVSGRAWGSALFRQRRVRAFHWLPVRKENSHPAYCSGKGYLCLYYFNFCWHWLSQVLVRASEKNLIFLWTNASGWLLVLKRWARNIELLHTEHSRHFENDWPELVPSSKTLGKLRICSLQENSLKQSFGVMCHIRQDDRDWEFPFHCVVFIENKQLLTGTSRGSVANSKGSLTCKTRLKAGLVFSFSKYSQDILYTGCVLDTGATSVNKTAMNILFNILVWGDG